MNVFVKWFDELLMFAYLCFLLSTEFNILFDIKLMMSDHFGGNIRRKRSYLFANINGGRYVCVYMRANIVMWYVEVSGCYAIFGMNVI